MATSQIFDPKGAFSSNLAHLEQITKYKAEPDQVPIKMAELTKPAGDSMIIVNEPGKFASLLLLYFLCQRYGDGESLLLTGKSYQTLRDFYGSLMNEAVGNHPTIDFLQKSGVTVTITE